MKLARPIAVAAGLIVLMISSAGLGASLALRWQNRRSPDWLRDGPGLLLMERWERQLRLTEEQRRHIQPALERARAGMRELAGDSTRRAGDIRRQLRVEIDPILTPQQRLILDRRQAIAFRWTDAWRRRSGSTLPTNEPPAQRPNP